MSPFLSSLFSYLWFFKERNYLCDIYVVYADLLWSDDAPEALFGGWFHCVVSPIAFTQLSHSYHHASKPWSLSSSSFHNTTFVGFSDQHHCYSSGGWSHIWSGDFYHPRMNDITDIWLWHKNWPNRMLGYHHNLSNLSSSHLDTIINLSNITTNHLDTMITSTT